MRQGRLVTPNDASREASWGRATQLEEGGEMCFQEASVLAGDQMTLLEGFKNIYPKGVSVCGYLLDTVKEK